MNNTQVGGWSEITLPTPADLVAFAKIQAKLPLGVIYIPIAVQRQVVAGMNYRFYCVRTTSPGHYSIVSVSAYIDLKGDVHDIVINPMSTGLLPEPNLGGWSKFAIPTKEETALFHKATSSKEGVDYTPVLVSKQIVGGTNYFFIAKAEVVNPSHTLLGFVPVFFYVDSNGTISKHVIINPLK